MKQKMIYIPDELHDYLKEEGNASQLITELLYAHYRKKQNHSKWEKYSIGELEEISKKEKQLRALQKELKVHGIN